MVVVKIVRFLPLLVPFWFVELCLGLKYLRVTTLTPSRRLLG
jgi:hypothetical protein